MLLDLPISSIDIGKILAGTPTIIPVPGGGTRTIQPCPPAHRVIQNVDGSYACIPDNVSTISIAGIDIPIWAVIGGGVLAVLVVASLAGRR